VNKREQKSSKYRRFCRRYYNDHFLLEISLIGVADVHRSYKKSGNLFPLPPPTLFYHMQETHFLIM